MCLDRRDWELADKARNGVLTEAEDAEWQNRIAESLSKNVQESPKKDVVVHCGETCPQCGEKEVDASNIKDVAFSIHYQDNEADFVCRNCGHKWHGQYGDRDPT